MHAGCGNSQLGAFMLTEGFANIVNVDYSEAVIAKMRERFDGAAVAELQSVIERQDVAQNFLGMEPSDGNESRDDKNINANDGAHTPRMTWEVGDVVAGLPYASKFLELDLGDLQLTATYRRTPGRPQQLTGLSNRLPR